MNPIDNPEARRFSRLRWSAFALGCGAFFLSFFHRVSTGAIANDLQHELAIGAAALGTLGATYYYVYALMQIPAGVLADTLGPRVTLTAGVLVAGAGSVAFGLTGDFATALVARTLIGLGVSVIFVCILKLHSNWFTEGRFATAAGTTNVAGILGAFAATAPLAWLVTLVPWRHVFVAIGIVSFVLAAAIWRFVRDAPAARVSQPGADGWRTALLQIAANRATWPAFFLSVGVSGAYMTFISLWAVPFLMHVHGRDAVAAGRIIALTLLAFACCTPVLGWMSDRLRVRRPLAIGFSLAFCLSWIVWLAMPVPAPYGVAFAAVLTGAAVPGFTLSWSIAKEVNPPAHAGMAIAITNIGGFLASGMLQPLVGWIIDHGAGVVAGGSADAYRLGFGALGVWSLIGLAAALRLTETHGRNIWVERNAQAKALYSAVR